MRLKGFGLDLIKSIFPMNCCFQSRATQLYTPLCPSVGRSVGLSVCLSITFYFFYEFYWLTSLLLPKWSNDLKYNPCPTHTGLG